MSEICQANTEALQVKDLVAKELTKVRNFYTNDENTKCTQSEATGGAIRNTCILDFNDAVHDLEDICGVYGGIYSESDYTFRCNNLSTDNFLIYNELKFPMCVDINCGQTGWKSFQQNAADSVKQWLEDFGYPNSVCSLMRLDPDVVDLPKEQPKNCEEATEQIMEEITQQTPGLTNHRSAKAIDCINQGNGNFECAIDFSDYEHGVLELCKEENGIYLEVDYTLMCTQKSGGSDTLRLEGTHDPYCVGVAFCQTQDFTTLVTERSNSMVSILNDEGWDCVTTGLEFEDFTPSASPSVSPAPTKTFIPSSAPSKSPAPTQTMQPSNNPTDLSCYDKTDEILQVSSVSQSSGRIQQEIDEMNENDICQDSSTNSQRLCAYDYSEIQHSLQSECESAGGTYLEHTMEVLCVQGSTKQETVHTYIDRPFCVAKRCSGVDMNDYLYDFYRSEVRDADIICPSQSLLEVLIGGRKSVEEQQVLEGCQAETNTAVSSIDVLNARSAIRADFIDLATGEIRNRCISPEPNKLDCEFDFEALGFRNSLPSVCPNQNGQYVTSTFTVTCTDPDEGLEVSFSNKNVPSCVGQCCRPGEALTLLKTDHLWFTDYYENTDNWDCTEIVVDSISTLQYNPNAVCKTEAPGGSPTLPPNNSGVDPDAPCSNVWGCYEGLNHALFGQIYQTMPPSPAPTGNGLDITFKDPSTEKSNDGALSGGVIAGIAIGVLLLICCLCGLLFLGYRQKKREMEKYNDDDYSDDEYDDSVRERGFQDEHDYYGERDQADAKTWTTNDWEGDEETNYRSRGGYEEEDDGDESWESDEEDTNRFSRRGRYT